MVLCTRVLYGVNRARSGFLDTLRLTVKGGTGGSGFPRYGGIGGRGGNVYVVSREGLTLRTVRDTLKAKRISAPSGTDSNSKSIIGLSAEDVTFEVPTGVTVYTADGALLGEVNKDGEKLLVARGGRGGCPDTEYCGVKGQSHTIVLDLKLIADVGLVGFPNAGKSTLLNAISNAKPKIAAYPFTTIRPQLGIVQYKDLRRITVADLPGLTEGAHINVGMGHKFLKHVERTKMLLFVVDIQGFQLSLRHNWRSCLETVVLLNKELELYKPELLDMPAALIVNKMDTPNADDIYKEIRPMLMNLSDAVHECEESIRPERVVQFNEILTASLIMKKQDEIQRIKEMVRSVIDKAEEAKRSSEETESPEEQLRKKLERFGRKCAPTLV